MDHRWENKTVAGFFSVSQLAITAYIDDKTAPPKPLV